MATLGFSGHPQYQQAAAAGGKVSRSMRVVGQNIVYRCDIETQFFDYSMQTALRNVARTKGDVTWRNVLGGAQSVTHGKL